MTVLPEPPAATAAGQATTPLTDAVISAAVDNAIEEARRHDTTPKVVIGSASPVQQPGRPAMSPRATDASVMMVAAGWLSLCLGTAVSAVLHFSGGANETVVICLCATPPATLLTLGRLLRRTKEVVAAAPTEVHQHFNGTVHQDQRNVDSKNYGVWVKNNNEQ